MTSIVQKIFVNRANAINADIVKNRDAIITECYDFASIISDAHHAAQMAANDPFAKAGTDAIREAIVTDGHFTWLYDATGKPNKKGVSKLIMSDHMRKIREGMLFLADANNAALFTAWTETDGAKKSGVCDFANIKKAIKPKTEKAETDASDASEDAASDATDAKRTRAEFLEWVFNQARAEFGMTAPEFMTFIADSKEGRAIYDKVA